MTATAEDVIGALKSIDASLKALCAHFGIGAKPTATAQTAVASDADLDGQYGNPEIKAKDPRDWTGPPMKGKRFSECPAAYLDLVADRLDYFAEREEETVTDETATTDDRKGAKKKAHYNRKDAGRARGWAARIREGYTPPAQPEGFPSDAPPPLDDSDIPF